MCAMSVLTERPAAPEEVDAVREFQLRRWARENYVALERRLQNWHPVVLDEMARKDAEQPALRLPARSRSALVPLAPTRQRYLDREHGLHQVPVLVGVETVRHCG